MIRVFVLTALCVLWVVLVCSQIILPLVQGRRLFPLFRYKDLRKEIDDLHEQLERRELEDLRDDLAVELEDPRDTYQEEK